MFVRIVSGIVALSALGWGTFAYFVNGQNLEAPSANDPHDWFTVGVCLVVLVIGVCGVVWGG